MHCACLCCLSIHRDGDYKEMQKASQTLYKQVPETRYMLWQIGSIYTQAITESDDLSENLQGFHLHRPVMG